MSSTKVYLHPLSVVSVELAYCSYAPDQTNNTVVLKFLTNAVYNKWGTYVGMDWSPLSLVSCTGFGNRSCLVCVLFLDLPSLHVSYFGTKCFYTCLCSFVLCSVCIFISHMGCILGMSNFLRVSGTWFV